MATKILLKKSVTSGAAPLTADLDTGELALNLADRKIYVKDNSGNIVTTQGAYVDSVAPANPAEGDLWYDTANNMLKAHNGSAFDETGYNNLSELEDVTLTSIASGDHLTWNGSAFVNSNLESDVEGFMSAANTGTGHGDLSYANGVYTFDRVTSAEVRGDISVTDAGGDGSLAYNSTTGVITYTGPSAAEVRAHISHVDAGGDGSLSYDASTGVITYTGPSAAEVRAHLSGGTGVTYTAGTGVIEIGQPVATSDSVVFADVETNSVHHAGDITLNPESGGAANAGQVIISGNLTVNGTTTSVNSNEVNIGDSIIVLNSDETGAPSQNAGFEVERGTSTNKAFIWNETDDAWDLADETLQNVVLDGGAY